MNQLSDNKGLNKNLYSSDLFKVWSEKTDLILLEAYFLKKYLSNKKGKIIEAGTGGGRIIFELEKLGYSNMEAFDYLDNMIGFCNEKKTLLKSAINFKTSDATDLSEYKDNDFDYLIYLQQVLCFADEENLNKALEESLRIGSKDAIYIFSFLNWDAKSYNPFLSLTVNFFRRLRHEDVNKYKLPWLKINEKLNWKLLNKNQPQNIWFKEQQIVQILKDKGFSIMEVKSRLNATDKKEHIHVACKKSSS